jgi:hypothetical protein
MPCHCIVEYGIIPEIYPSALFVHPYPFHRKIMYYDHAYYHPVLSPHHNHHNHKYIKILKPYPLSSWQPEPIMETDHQYYHLDVNNVRHTYLHFLVSMGNAICVVIAIAILDRISSHLDRYPCNLERSNTMFPDRISHGLNRYDPSHCTQWI